MLQGVTCAVPATVEGWECTAVVLVLGLQTPGSLHLQGERNLPEGFLLLPLLSQTDGRSRAAPG